jgi:hypothetical protein
MSDRVDLVSYYQAQAHHEANQQGRHVGGDIAYFDSQVAADTRSALHGYVYDGSNAVVEVHRRGEAAQVADASASVLADANWKRCNSVECASVHRTFERGVIHVHATIGKDFSRYRDTDRPYYCALKSSEQVADVNFTCKLSDLKRLAEERANELLILSQQRRDQEQGTKDRIHAALAKLTREEQQLLWSQHAEWYPWGSRWPVAKE